MLDTYSYASILNGIVSERSVSAAGTDLLVRDLERLAQEMRGLCGFPGGCQDESADGRRMCSYHLQQVGRLFAPAEG